MRCHFAYVYQVATLSDAAYRFVSPVVVTTPVNSAMRSEIEVAREVARAIDAKVPARVSVPRAPSV
jgi:hypothetical protein